MEFREQQGTSFEEAERRYAELERRYDAGQISDEEFDTERQRLMVRDEEGRWWAKTRQTGQWLYHDGSAWIEATPPVYQQVSSGDWPEQAEPPLSGSAWDRGQVASGPPKAVSRKRSVLLDVILLVAVLVFVGGGIGMWLRQSTQEAPPPSPPGTSAAPKESVPSKETPQQEKPGSNLIASPNPATENEPEPDSEPKTKREPKAAVDDSDVSSQEELRSVVEDYYEAVDLEDWTSTYDVLDSQTRQRFTRDEWTRKNQYFAAEYPLVKISPTIVGPESSPSKVKVTVYRTFQNLPSDYRDTYFVYEGGSWKHQFSQEEFDLFMADASVEEFKRNR